MPFQSCRRARTTPRALRADYISGIEFQCAPKLPFRGTEVGSASQRVTEKVMCD